MERSVHECECKAQSTSESKVFGFLLFRKSHLIKAETNGLKMMKFGANVTQTALKGLNLAKTGNYDHVLNIPVGLCHLVYYYYYVFEKFIILPKFGPFWTDGLAVTS